MKNSLIKNSSTKSVRNVFTVILVLGIVACVFPVNLSAFAFSNAQSASLVIGQPGFTTNTAVVSQTGLSTHEIAFNGPTFDSSGNLWVADETAHRVLEYLASSVSVSVPEFPFGIPVVIVTMGAFYFMMRRKFSLKI